MALRRTLNGGAFGAAGAAGLALAICFWRLGPGDPVTDAAEARLYDLRMQLRGARAAPASVAIVAVDEEAAARIGMGVPMRAALAEAVRRLRRAGAAAIAIDLLLVDPTAVDSELAATLAAGDEAILAVAALPGAPAAPSRNVELDRALQRSAFGVVADRRPSGAEGATTAARAVAVAGPTAALAAAAWLGHVNVARAPDRVLRRLPLAIDLGGGVALPAMPLAAARIALGLPRDALTLTRREGARLGERFIATDARGGVLIDHPGRAGTIERVSLGAMLEGAEPPGGFRGRAVFIGATAQTLGDIGATPLDPDAPGVESLAAVAAQIIEGRRLDDGPMAWLATLVIATTAAFGVRVAALIPRPGVAAAASMAICLAAALTVLAAFASAGLVVDATAVLSSVAAVGALGWFVGRTRERRLAQAEARERARLQPHVSPLLAQRDALGRDADRPRPAAVVFVDMIGSTGMAEKVGADAAGLALAAAQRRIGAAATRHGGVVVEVIGDGALVVFGLPDHGESAAAGALDFLRALSAPGDGPRFRATAHFGPVVIADLGSEGRRWLSVAGDTVNVASRMQDVARSLGAPYLASAQAVAAAGGAPDFGPLTTAYLPGRSAALDILALGAATGGTAAAG